MTWSSKTLADTLPAAFSSANAAAAAAQRELNAINAALASLQSALTQAQQRANTVDELANSFAGDAASSGIYQLNLGPDTGLWNERILNATGAPPRDPAMHSAIICTLSLTADLSAATAAEQALKEAVSSEFKPAPPKIKVPGLKPPAKPEPPALPEPEPMPENEWKSATVADLFPGSLKSVMDSGSAVKAEADKLQKGVDEMQKKQAELQDALDKAQTLANNLAQSGVYSFTAGPEIAPSADWYQRLIEGAEQQGRPPFNANLFSSGSVTVVVASSYLQLMQRFNKLQKALSTPLI